MAREIHLDISIAGTCQATVRRHPRWPACIINLKSPLWPVRGLQAIFGFCSHLNRFASAPRATITCDKVASSIVPALLSGPPHQGSLERLPEFAPRLGQGSGNAIAISSVCRLKTYPSYRSLAGRCVPDDQWLLAYQGYNRAEYVQVTGVLGVSWLAGSNIVAALSWTTLLLLFLWAFQNGGQVASPAASLSTLCLSSLGHSWKGVTLQGAPQSLPITPQTNAGRDTGHKVMLVALPPASCRQPWALQTHPSLQAEAFRLQQELADTKQAMLQMAKRFKADQDLLLMKVAEFERMLQQTS